MSDPLFIIGKSVPKFPREIAPGLFQSGAAEAIDICSSGEMLQKIGLKAVLTVAHDIRVKVPANLIHLHIPVDEIHETPAKYFDLACSLNVFPMLVHCMAGANRSRVFAAAIAWKCRSLALEEAIAIADPPPSGVVYDSMMKWAKE
jgi:hypothetical protein